MPALTDQQQTDMYNAIFAIKGFLDSTTWRKLDDEINAILVAIKNGQTVDPTVAANLATIAAGFRKLGTP